ncbi:carbon-nitrogen hydrolase family protein [Candidatus Bipolaricaulota bacterium]|nr:carbon-nitrogen hydrolase family protein [Candidatus Bipolaricaulota bacterium]
MESGTKIALIQQHATNEVTENLERGVENFKRAANNGADLIAFPELAFLPFLPQSSSCNDSDSYAESIPGELTDRFRSLAREYEAVVVLNMYERDGDKTYDSSPILDADGELLGVTRMVHIMEGPGFHEKEYYTPGRDSKSVFNTAVGKVGVAICYDRHYPEYMRYLGLEGAEIVVVPQAGATNEWSEGIFEAELQVASFQNGYFSALVNRVGKEEVNHFSGGSYVVDPDGQIVSKAGETEDEILYAKLDPGKIEQSSAKQHFLKDRRSGYYRNFDLLRENPGTKNP